jgi:acyl-CoA thioesterase YciA
MCAGRMATVAVNEFIFKQPVPCRWRSMPSAIDTQGHYIKVTEASLTYVAIDDQGRPRPIERPEP